MRNAIVILLICFGSLCLIGCGDDNPSGPKNDVQHYNLSGMVIPQFYGTYGQHGANNVTMVFVDSDLDTQIVMTDMFGNFEVTDLAEGSVSVSMFSTDTVFTAPVNYRALPFYLPKDETIFLTQDTVVNWGIRRIEMIFADAAYNPEYWLWEYGVKNEDGKYIFWYDIRGSDMRMANNVHVPEKACRVGFILLGEAAPSYSSTINVYLYINDVRQTIPLPTSFTTTESYWIEPLTVDDEGIEGVLDDDIRLALEFEKELADFIYIKQIFIYIY